MKKLIETLKQESEDLKKRVDKHILETILEIGSISINGVEINLTDEQIKTIEQSIKPKNKMGKPKDREIFYRILQKNGKFFVKEYEFHKYARFDEETYQNKGCFLDKDLAEQTAMDMNLKAQLRSFTYENGYDNELDEEGKTKYYIHLTKSNIQINEEVGYAIFDVIYFKDKETCIEAINQVVIPFLCDNPKHRFAVI